MWCHHNPECMHLCLCLIENALLGGWSLLQQRGVALRRLRVGSRSTKVLVKASSDGRKSGWRALVAPTTAAALLACSLQAPAALAIACVEPNFLAIPRELHARLSR